MMHAIGAEDAEGFVAVGAEFLRHFIELADLRADDRGLEVGSGAGRMAIPLTGYLSRKASYDAFDVYGDGVAWCQREITPRFPNFRFEHADLFSKRYNAASNQAAATYRFPWADASFDFVFLTSVFTHLLPGDLEHYATEIGRVLRPGGRCFITWFLLNDESRPLVESQKSQISFIPQDAVYWVNSYEVPEWAVAYDEGYVLELYGRAGLTVRRPFHYGSWAGRAGARTAHDLVVADRDGP